MSRGSGERFFRRCRGLSLLYFVPRPSAVARVLRRSAAVERLVRLSTPPTKTADSPTIYDKFVRPENSYHQVFIRIHIGNRRAYSLPSTGVTPHVRRPNITPSLLQSKKQKENCVYRHF